MGVNINMKKTNEQRIKNLTALVIILAGLFAGSLFVDLVQLVLGSGFSRMAVKEYNLLETGGRTWVAYNEQKVTAQVITNRDCPACDPSEALIWLRRVIPTLEVSPIEDDSDLGKLLIERFGIVSLPAFIFSESITETDFYAQAGSLFRGESGKYFFDMGKIGLPAGRYINTPICQ